MQKMWLLFLIIFMPVISYADNCFIQDIHGNCLKREQIPTPPIPTQQVEQQSPSDSSSYQPQQQTEQTSSKTDVESGGSEVLNGFLGVLFLIFAGCSIYTCSKASRGEMLFYHDWNDAIGAIVITILALVASTNSQIFLGVLLWIGAVIYNGYRVYGVYSNDKIKLALVTASRILVSLLIPFLFVLIICSFFIGDKKSKGKSLTSTLGGIAMLAGLTYFLNSLVNRRDVKDTYEEAEPKLTMELKYTPGPEYEPIKFENPKDILCPYCNYRFEEMLKRSRKCPECKKYIYRKKDYENKIHQLITEEQYDKEVDENNKNYSISNQEDMRDRLLRYQDSTCSGVRISTSGDSRVCPACAKQQGKLYSIEDALKAMPLPCKDCSSGYCRCCYIPEI